MFSVKVTNRLKLFIAVAPFLIKLKLKMKAIITSFPLPKYGAPGEFSRPLPIISSYKCVVNHTTIACHEFL